MKTALLSLIGLLFSHYCFLFGQCPATPVATISGTTCLGSTLTVSSSIPPSSIIWKLNGSTVVSTQTATLQTNGMTIAGSAGGGSAANQLRNPDRIFVASDGTVYIPDLGNNRIQKWAPGATSGITVAGGNGSGSASNQFNRPTSVFVDKQGNIYVADQNNGRIQKWATGSTSGITVAGGIYGALSLPTDVFLDEQGNIYASEQGNSAVKKWSPGSTVPITVAGGNGYGSSATTLSSPTGIFVDAQGNVYVCDTDNNRVQKWARGASSGVTVAGGNGFGFNANQLSNPIDIYVDCAGTMYIADFTNNRIQKWMAGASSGVTIAGGNGSGSGANQFNGPIGVYMDSTHTLYVADFNNNRIQKFLSPITATYTPTVAGDYTATIVYNGGNVVSNSISIVAPQTLSASIIASSLNICQGDAVRFTATPVNAGNAPQFQWKKNGVNVGNNSDTYGENNMINGDVVTCVVSSNASCISPSSVTSNTLTINVNKNPVVTLDHANTLCEGSSRQLDAGNFASFLWNDGSTGSNLFVNAVGTYYVTVTDNNGCKGSDTARITSLLPMPSQFLPADSFICNNISITLRPSRTFNSYLWSNGATNADIQISAPGVYWLEVTNDQNCKGRSIINVTAKDCLLGFHIPNAFTPNNDHKNDFFRPLIYGAIKKFDFLIYNRWGQIVFHSTDANKGWNGTVSNVVQPAGVYVWFCTYQLEGQKPESRKGSFNLIR